ncbi:unnamed protein product, partial [Allacma fusca]
QKFLSLGTYFYAVIALPQPTLSNYAQGLKSKDHKKSCHTCSDIP